MLPGVQQAISALLPKLPTLRAYIADTARGLGEMAQQAVAAFNSPTWRRFAAVIGSDTVPALQAMQEISLNTAEGLAGLMVALRPFNRPLGQGLVEMSKSFAVWAAQLDNNTGFQQFIGYVRDNAPKVLDLLGELATVAGHIVQAYAPIGGTVVSTLTALARVINAIPVPVLTALAGAFTAYSTAARIAAIRTSAMSGSMNVLAPMVESAHEVSEAQLTELKQRWREKYMSKSRAWP